MKPQPRTTIGILRTVLHLLEDDPALGTDSETVLEFRRVATKLIAEIEARHCGVKESLNPSLDQAKQVPLLSHK